MHDQTNESSDKKTKKRASSEAERESEGHETASSLAVSWLNVSGHLDKGGGSEMAVGDSKEEMEAEVEDIVWSSGEEEKEGEKEESGGGVGVEGGGGGDETGREGAEEAASEVAGVPKEKGEREVEGGGDV